MQSRKNITSYFRCPDNYSHFIRRKSPFASKGYFSFGQNATCYGYCNGYHSKSEPSQDLHDALEDTRVEDEWIYLPFDPDEIVTNLRREVYAAKWWTERFSLVARLYYFIRPSLPVGVRRHLQQLHLRGRNQSDFPRWPVDCSVDNILGSLMMLALRASGEHRIPFIWFWPDAKSSCAIMTHDVETASGRDFCSTLMNVDDAYGIKSSFQVIPEQRYHISEEFLDSIRSRGFEIAVHDLNHDGHLYRNRAQFLLRAKKINAYLKQFRTGGFRAGALYRRQLWYDALKCSYDMSVPNTARFDPQSGGCCTVMPYFVGDVLAIPVTTIQDYTLFHILNDYSIDIWRHQTEEIMKKHGLMSFIVHPDYITKERPRHVYELLLDHLRELRQTQGVWGTTPGQLDRWWRQRAAMSLVQLDGEWTIQGEGSERASVAYASEVDGQLVFDIADGPHLSGATAHCGPHKTTQSFYKLEET